MESIDIGQLAAIYRAVGLEEYYSIIRKNEFSCHPAGAEVKYFGLDRGETEEFANLIINVDVVAVFGVIIPSITLEQVGDFTKVDTFLFKKGTVEIHKADLNIFNDVIESITQVL